MQIWQLNSDRCSFGMCLFSTSFNRCYCYYLSRFVPIPFDYTLCKTQTIPYAGGIYTAVCRYALTQQLEQWRSRYDELRIGKYYYGRILVSQYRSCAILLVTCFSVAVPKLCHITRQYRSCAILLVTCFSVAVPKLCHITRHVF